MFRELRAALEPDPAAARLDADDRAAGGRLATGAAGVGAGREGDHVRRHRGPGTAARAAGGAVGGQRVAGRAVHPVPGRRLGAELGRVRLADQDRAGRAHLREPRLVAVGDLPGPGERAAGEGQAGRFVQVLGGERQAVEETALGGRKRVGGVGVGQGLLGPQGDDRVDLRVQRLDPRQRRFADLAGRDPVAAEQLAQLDRGHRGERGIHSRLGIAGRHRRDPSATLASRNSSTAPANAPGSWFGIGTVPPSTTTIGASRCSTSGLA